MKGLIIAPGLDNYLAIHCLNELKPEFITFPSYFISDVKGTINLIPNLTKIINPKEKNR